MRQAPTTAQGMSTRLATITPTRPASKKSRDLPAPQSHPLLFLLVHLPALAGPAVGEVEVEGQQDHQQEAHAAAQHRLAGLIHRASRESSTKRVAALTCTQPVRLRMNLRTGILPART